MTTTTVYYFTKYDISIDQILTSKRPATLEAIARARGEAIPQTASEIDVRDLDREGFRRRDFAEQTATQS